MKVQIFPKVDLAVRQHFCGMGALTLKPGAYGVRPWETTRTTVFNYVDGTGTLVFHTRGGRVHRVTQTGWITDRVRFLYDGLRRQRLTIPVHQGGSTGWSTLVAGVVHLLPRGWSPRVDPGGTHLWWWFRGTAPFQDGRLTRVALAVDTNYTGQVYLGGWGLPGVTTAVWGVPTWTTYEEDTVVTPPTGGVSASVGAALWGQLVGWTHRYRWSHWVTPVEVTPRVAQRALFQVSPLQGLLHPGW